MAFEIEFYKTKDGKEPVVDFLDSLDDKMAAKLVKELKLAKERRADWLERHKEVRDDT